MIIIACFQKLAQLDYQLLEVSTEIFYYESICCFYEELLLTKSCVYISVVYTEYFCSKVLGFLNPSSQLLPTDVTDFCMQLRN